MSKSNKKDENKTTMLEQVWSSNLQKGIYLGDFNRQDPRWDDFIELTKLTQVQLKAFLEEEMQKYYDKANIQNGDGYLYIKGNTPIILTAHMDVVHPTPVKDWYVQKSPNGKHMIASPQGIAGDDRCGIWEILYVLRNTEYRPSIIFCEDEEVGEIGATKFCYADGKEVDLDEIGMNNYFVIEIDRRHSHDLVYYDLNSRLFEDFCAKATGWKTATGSCSDISTLCPELGIAGVNMSAGYYDEHHLWHYVIFEEMRESAQAVIKLIKAGVENGKTFEYKEFPRSTWSTKGYSNYGGWYGREYESPYGYSRGESYGYGYYGNEKANGTYFDTLKVDEDGDEDEDFFEDEVVRYLTITFTDYEYVNGELIGTVEEVEQYGSSLAECFLQFFSDHPEACMNDIHNWTLFNESGHFICSKDDGTI